MWAVRCIKGPYAGMTYKRKAEADFTNNYNCLNNASRTGGGGKIRLATDSVRGTRNSESLELQPDPTDCALTTLDHLGYRDIG